MAGRELRAAIVEGRLKLGDPISELRLSEMLGISKTPVREALLTLEREGLVVIDPRRATSVFHIDRAEIDSIRAFREMLEARAAEGAFAGDRAAFGAELGEVVGRMRDALGQDDRREYRVLDARFHDVILAHGGNPYLRSAYGLIATKIGALRTRAQDSDRVVQSSLRTHARLHALVLAGDLAGFRALLATHIENTGTDYLRWLAAQAADGPGAPP